MDPNEGSNMFAILAGSRPVVAPNLMQTMAYGNR
jgi:hypothetical protein